MNCKEVEELAGAYALGALPEEERSAVSAHLVTCKKHPEMRGLKVAAASLALAAPEVEPPPELKSRLMAVVRAEAPRGRKPASRQSRQSFGDTIREWFSSPWPGYGLASVLSVIVVFLVAWNINMQDEATSVIPVSGNASGRVFYMPDEKIAVMDVGELTPLPEGKVYEIWAMTDGVATPLGLLEVDSSGDATALVQVDASGVDLLAVTAEQSPGVSQPTSEPIFTAQFS